MKDNIELTLFICEVTYYFLGLYLSHYIFRKTDNLATALQNKDLSASEGKRLADLTLISLAQIRDEENANQFFETVRLKADELGE